MGARRSARIEVGFYRCELLADLAIAAVQSGSLMDSSVHAHIGGRAAEKMNRCVSPHSKHASGGHI